MLKHSESIRKWTNWSQKASFGLLQTFHIHNSDQNNNNTSRENQRKGIQKRGLAGEKLISYMSASIYFIVVYCFHAKEITVNAHPLCVRGAVTLCSPLTQPSWSPWQYVKKWVWFCSNRALFKSQKGSQIWPVGYHLPTPGLEHTMNWKDSGEGRLKCTPPKKSKLQWSALFDFNKCFPFNAHPLMTIEN